MAGGSIGLDEWPIALRRSGHMAPNRDTLYDVSHPRRCWTDCEGPAPVERWRMGGQPGLAAVKGKNLKLKCAYRLAYGF